MTPPEGCDCEGRRCPVGESCLTLPSRCVSACPRSSSSSSSSIQVVVASTDCGCNKTVCTAGLACDWAASHCFTPCSNPALLQANNIQKMSEETLLLGLHHFQCNSGYYVKTKGVTGLFTLTSQQRK